MKERRLGGFLIAKIHRAAGRIFARKLREHGLDVNPAQGRILFPIWQHGRMTIQELAQRSGLGKSTLTSMLDRLEAAGHVARVPCPGDRRKTLIELRAGKKLLHVYERVSDEMTGLFYEGFRGEEIEIFERCLARVLGNLENIESPGAGGEA